MLNIDGWGQGIDIQGQIGVFQKDDGRDKVHDSQPSKDTSNYKTVISETCTPSKTSTSQFVESLSYMPNPVIPRTQVSIPERPTEAEVESTEIQRGCS